MKLKTVKDLAKFKLNKVEDWNKSKWRNWNETKASKSNVCFDRDLKQEAIKWVKECFEGNKIMDVTEFMKFHNITEEDLK